MRYGFLTASGREGGLKGKVVQLVGACASMLFTSWHRIKINESRKLEREGSQVAMMAGRGKEVCSIYTETL